MSKSFYLVLENKEFYQAPTLTVGLYHTKQEAVQVIAAKGGLKENSLATGESWRKGDKSVRYRVVELPLGIHPKGVVFR
jgi:hypothetical protein